MARTKKEKVEITTEEVIKDFEENVEETKEVKEAVEEKPAKKTSRKKSTKKAAEAKEVEEVPFEEAEPAKPEDMVKYGGSNRNKTDLEEQFDQMIAAEPETKEERFHRIAPGRVSRVLDALRIMGHCSNLSIYEYSEEEVDKMFTAIRRKVDSLENNFREKLESNQEVDFKF